MVSVSASAVQPTGSSASRRVALSGIGTAFAALLAAQEDQEHETASSVVDAAENRSVNTASGIEVSLQEVSGPLMMGPKEISAFGQDLTRRLARAGVNTDRDIALKVGPDGHVTAADGDPDKDKIDALFASDPDLENRYRGVSSALTMKAMARADKVYVEDYDKAKTDKEREEVWRRHQATVAQILSTSGQMTLSGGAVTSPGLEMMGGSSLLG